MQDTTTTGRTRLRLEFEKADGTPADVSMALERDALELHDYRVVVMDFLVQDMRRVLSER